MAAGNKEPFLVKTSIWGKEVYCDPKTGKPLKDQKKAQDQKLKKAGWW